MADAAAAAADDDDDDDDDATDRCLPRHALRDVTLRVLSDVVCRPVCHDAIGAVMTVTD